MQHVHSSSRPTSSNACTQTPTSFAAPHHCIIASLRPAGTITVNDSLDLLAEFMGCGESVAEVTNKVITQAAAAGNQHCMLSISSAWSIKEWRRWRVLAAQHQLLRCRVLCLCCRPCHEPDDTDISMWQCYADAVQLLALALA